MEGCVGGLFIRRKHASVDVFRPGCHAGCREDTRSTGGIHTQPLKPAHGDKCSENSNAAMLRTCTETDGVWLCNVHSHSSDGTHDMMLTGMTWCCLTLVCYLFQTGWTVKFANASEGDRTTPPDRNKGGSVRGLILSHSAAIFVLVVPPSSCTSACYTVTLFSPRAPTSGRCWPSSWPSSARVPAQDRRNLQTAHWLSR